MEIVLIVMAWFLVVVFILRLFGINKIPRKHG